MAGIYITKDSVERSQEFLMQYLRDAGYDGNLEDGSALYDLLIKGYALLNALFQQQKDKVTGYLSLERAQALKDELGEEYDAAIDAILSNWFVSRKAGTATTGRVRLWFSRPTDFLHLVPGEASFKYDDEFFEVAREYVFSAADFELVSNTPQVGEEYYVDVDVVSMEKVRVSIARGEILSSYINNVYFLRAEAADTFILGKGQETSDEFIARTTHAITTRELVSDNAIMTVLPEQFSDVEHVYVAGYSDPEQLRDIVVFDDMAVHVGNKADIYVRTPFRKTTVQATVGADGSIDLAALLGADAHVAHVFDVSLIGADDTRTPAIFTVTVSGTDWLTAGAACTLAVDLAHAGALAEITYLYAPAIPSVHDFVTDSGQRVGCYDPFVKSMHPVILSMALEVVPGKGTLEELQPYVVQAIQEYVLDIGYLMPYAESAMIEYMHRTVANLGSVTVPINASFSVFNEKASAFFSGNCGSSLLVPKDASLSAQITERTIQFYTDSSLITFL